MVVVTTPLNGLLISTTSTHSPQPTTDPPLPITIIRIVLIPLLILIIIFGLVGNALTMCVLRTKKLRTSSTSLYLTVLAFVDLLYLCTSLGSTVVNLIFFFPKDMRSLHPGFCHLLPLLNYSLTYISVWLLVAVTIDRMIWVILPFSAKKICTRGKAMTVTIGLALLFITIDLHFIWSVNYEVPTNSSRNTSQPTAHEPANRTSLQAAEISPKCMPTFFTKKVFPYIDLVIMGVLPFIVMITANTLIINKLRQMKRVRQNHLGKGNATPANVGNQGSNTPATSSGDKTSLTTMLLSINFFFMVSISPLLVYDIVYFGVDLEALIEQNKVLGTVFYGIERTVYTLWYLNFAVHFLLYCLSGPKFREEAMKMLGLKEDGCLSTNTTNHRQEQLANQNDKNTNETETKMAFVNNGTTDISTVESTICSKNGMVNLEPAQSKSGYQRVPIQISCPEESDDDILVEQKRLDVGKEKANENDNFIIKKDQSYESQL